MIESPVPARPGFWRPFLLSCVAGSSTGLGGALVIFLDTSSRSSHIAWCLGFSAGVMMTISFFDLLIPPVYKAVTSFQPFLSLFFCLFWFLLGVFTEMGLSKVLPDESELGESLLPFALNRTSTTSTTSTTSITPTTNKRRFRLGILLSVTLALHNFPEGLAVAASNLADDQLGLLMTVAIAVHNIPEGLCVAVPIYSSTGSVYQATKLAFLSGLTEPIGALAALFLFSGVDPTWHGMMLQYTLVFVGGVMISVSLRELIPEAIKSGHSKAMKQGLVGGALVMGCTMLVV